jgi:hypothetical protein
MKLTLKELSPENDVVGELADGFLSPAGNSGCHVRASGSNHPGI